MISRRKLLHSAAAVAWAQACPMAAAVDDSTVADASAFLRKRDYRHKPFGVAVAIGDSITAGGTATSRELTWVSKLAALINQAQLAPVQMINSGIGSNEVSPRSAYYEQLGKVSAMERYQKHVVDHHPDLVLISYGVNDAMAGTPVEVFLDDLRYIALDIQKKTNAVVAILDAYLVRDFHRYPPTVNGSIASIVAYNCGMKRVAEECDLLFVDVFGAYGMAPWALDEDGVHPNNLGHTLIANRVFEVLAQNCSCLAQRAFELRKTFSPWRDESGLRKLYQ